MKYHSNFCTDTIAKKKWKHLRDNFWAELKERAPPRSGDAAKSPNKAQWKWFDSMLFLKGTVEARGMEGNLAQEGNEVQELSEQQPAEQHDNISEGDDSIGESASESGVSRSSTFVTPSFRKRKRPQQFDELLAIEKEKVELVRSQFSQENNKDTTYHFLKSLREPMRFLPMSSQMRIRLNFQQMLTNEIEKYQQSAASSQLQYRETVEN